MATHSQHIHTFFPEISDKYRLEILKDLKKYSSQLQQSHLINNRWENLYLDPYRVPAVKHVFLAASVFAKKITNKSVIVPHQGLGISFDEFWFNVAKSGESTGWHDHKKKAIISGVYYLDIHDNSGDIHFRSKVKERWNEWSLKSETGKMILFDSKLEHSVSENKSCHPRISLAFNLYTLPLEIQDQSAQYSTGKFFQ